MKNGDWRSRLEAAVADSGKSKRAISLASDNGPGYVHSILSEGKEPTVEKLLAVCDQVPVSGIYILYGLDVRPDDLEILKALQDKPASRDGILQIIKSAAS